MNNEILWLGHGALGVEFRYMFRVVVYPKYAYVFSSLLSPNTPDPVCSLDFESKWQYKHSHIHGCTVVHFDFCLCRNVWLNVSHVSNMMAALIL